MDERKKERNVDNRINEKLKQKTVKNFLFKNFLPFNTFSQKILCYFLFMLTRIELSKKYGRRLKKFSKGRVAKKWALR